MLQTSRPTRRQLLAATASTAIAASCLPGANSVASLLSDSEPNAIEDDVHPWVDAHSHIWSTDLTKYPLDRDRLDQPTTMDPATQRVAEKIDRFVTMDSAQEQAAKELGLPVSATSSAVTL